MWLTTLFMGITLMVTLNVGGFWIAGFIVLFIIDTAIS